MDSVIAAGGQSAPIGSGRVARDMRGKLTLARLPAMPQVLVQLLEICQDEDASLGDVAALVARDAALAARILSISASASYHGRSRPASLEQCLSLLGMNAVKTLVINDSVMQVFNRFIDGRQVDLTVFWEHSLRSALVARELARRTGYSSPDEAYLAGLIHDVGRLAMLATDPAGYTEIFFGHQDDTTLCALETETFALTHVEVSAWLAEKWALDSFIGDGVLYHHEPVERIVTAHALVRIVFLANRLASPATRQAAVGDRDLFARLGMAIDEPDALLAGVDGEVVKLCEQLGIKLPAPGQAEAGQPSADVTLAARLQDILLVNQVLGDSLRSAGLESALPGTLQAMKILFDLDAEICFECIDGAGERFRARPLGNQGRRLFQLEFTRGDSASLLAKSLLAGPAVVTRDTAGLAITDDQVLRLVGGAGMVLLPLRRGRACLGVLVAGIATPGQVASLRQRLPCLSYFGRMGAELMAESAKLPPPPMPAPAGDDQRLNRLVHEISNPLAIIRNYLALLESDNAGKGISQPELAIVREEIDRVGKMLRSVRGQGEPAPAGPGPVDVNRCLKDLVALLRASIPLTGPVDIRLDLFDGLPEIHSDRDRLKQLFINLMKNSIEAMPAGGTLRVGTAPWGAGAGPSHVEVCIEDNGPGMPREVLARLYQPVASSKGGQHQGLGLSIVGQLVRDLRGLINCRSDGGGTRFQLLLPCDGK